MKLAFILTTTIGVVGCLSPLAAGAPPLSTRNGGGKAFPLSYCKGDCDNDEECQGDLVCFTREGTEDVPGCSGQGKTGDDYCTVRPSDNYLIYKGRGKKKLALCEGDCNKNSDCATGFYCFKRRRFDLVPGCEGKGVRDKNYCIPKATLPPTKQVTSAPSTPSSISPDDYVWTKAGLEAIPFEDWKLFSGDHPSSLYVKNFPFPGDNFTVQHLEAFQQSTGDATSKSNLLEKRLIQDRNNFLLEAADNQEPITKVPSVFSDPIVIKESIIDYRLQFATDIGSNAIGESAAKGRLVNPAGRRLREHFYRFPDQCDATPIALEVFLRLMIYDQIEAFFRDTKIGLWHDLFQDVKRRTFNTEELSVARWYGERYAEGYVHQITNGWVYPLGGIQNIDTYMLAVGLDPNDSTMDPATPAGLGNLVGKKSTEWLAASDGLQKDMDFVDIEGLERIAERHPSPSWNQWKPTYAGSSRFQGIRNGIVTQQTFVSPSIGIFSFLYTNEQDFVDLDLQSAVPELSMSEEAYVARSKEFLEIQKNMTDYEKAVAELSNNKISGSIFLIRAYKPLLQKLAPSEDYPRLYDEFSMVTSGCAEYAATHAAWRHKRTYLAGRPKTIIHHLAKTNAAFAAEHPDAATFEPMIPAGDHPEYPSGSSAIYTAFAQSADDWFLGKFGFEEASKKTGSLTFTIPASKFYWTDGPSEDVTLEYKNLNAWIEELPMSRVYGGVHFLEAGNAGVALGKKVGSACSRLLNRLNAGDYEATYTYPFREKINPFNPTSLE